MIYTLTTPIEIAGKEVTELDIKEERLDTKLIKRLGFPFTVGADLTPARTTSPASRLFRPLRSRSSAPGISWRFAGR